MALIASDIPGLDRDKFGFLFHFLNFQLLTSPFLFQSSLLKCVLFVLIFRPIYIDIVPISPKRATFFLLFLLILSSIPIF